MDSIDLDKIYREMPLDKIPWNSATPPGHLVDLIRIQKIKPCRTIDLGCGAGNYSVYLAQQGFEVTGIDISPTAIEYAVENGKRNEVKCDFISADLIDNPPELAKAFDFAFEWELLHHILPENRYRYIRNIAGYLKPDSVYFSLCFSENSPQFGGKGKFRKTPIGTLLYFSSEKELNDLYSLWFDIIEMKTVSIPGKRVSHLAVYSFLKRNDQMPD